jgi:hypothetical protein
MSAARTLRPIRDIPMDWRIVRFDETAYYNEAWLKEHKVVKCWSFYVYDKNRHVHLCEITPSYELWTVAFDFQCADDASDEDNESAWEAMLEAESGDEDVTYMHVSTIDRFEEQGNTRECKLDPIELDDVDSQFEKCDEPIYRQAAENLREHYSGNHPGW